MSERDFMQEIIDEAHRLDYLVFHTHDARRSEPGFPDLVMVAPKIKIAFIVETKAAGGKPTDAQNTWLERLDNCRVESALWRPKDKAHAFSLLQRYGEEPWQEVVARVEIRDRMTAAEYRELVKEGRV